MRQMMILAAVVILAAGMAGAADKTNIVLRSGESVTNASITRVEPDGITLMYGPHIRKCAFTELSDDVQQQFGYNPTNAAAYADKTARKLQANARRDAEARQAQADEAAEKERAAKAAAVEAKKSPADKEPNKKLLYVHKCTRMMSRHTKKAGRITYQNVGLRSGMAADSKCLALSIRATNSA